MLDADLGYLTVVVYGPPHTEVLSGDLDEHLVEMPARCWRVPKPSQARCDLETEPQYPLAYRLIAHLDTALGQHDEAQDGRKNATSRAQSRNLLSSKS